MGLFQSRQDRGVEDLEIASRTYGYPPKFGNYFSSHFIMGGEKFKTVNPECFLFGDNCDLNYLSNKPVAFPYQAPAPNEPSRTLRSLVHLRKDSLKLAKFSENLHSSTNYYKIEFTFDTDVPCVVRIFLFATESLAGGLARYTTKERQSEPVFFQKGSNKVYNDNFLIDPSKFNENEFQYQPGGSPNEAMPIPIVIQITVEEEEFSAQCEITFATFEKNSDGSYSIKLLKQKIFADGVCYIMQEIYGIENKKDDSNGKDNDYDENGTECVICMCDTRDTLILPCRHLCLCNGCANSLRYQASNCPICRSPFHALLQIKAVRKKTASTAAVDGAPKVIGKEGNNDLEEYEEVPLIEALNGHLPPEGAAGYSSRQSSARRSRSRNGSRPGSKKSRTNSRSGCRSSTGLPPDKLEYPFVSRSISCPEDPPVIPPPAGVKQTSIDIEEANDAKDDDDTMFSEARRESKTTHLEELQSTLQSQALKELIIDAHNNADETTYVNATDAIPNVDMSLPGTPMGSDSSDRSSSSLSTQRTTSTTASSGNSIYSARAQISTPSNVDVEEL